MAHEAVAGLSREDVLARIRARILAFARRLSPADAEDLTQEALVLLTTKYAPVAAPEELVALGAQIVRFKRAAYWRKAARRRALGEAEAPSTDDGAADAFELAASGTPDPEAIARARQRLAMLVEAAARLDGRCRDMLRRKLEGASFMEMAAEFGRPVNTVYSWDYGCLQRLKDLLAERWAFVSGEDS
jgi:RNA polymerase sigma factor (sigma-70 family)